MRKVLPETMTAAIRMT